MPQKIINPEIVALVEVASSEIQEINKANEFLEKRRHDLESNPELLAINAEQEALNVRAKNLTENAKKLNDALNQEYGWGNWHNLNVKTCEFQTREELELDPEFNKKHYIMANPAVREKVRTDDVEVTERKVMNDVELCQKVDELIKDQVCI